MSMMMLMLMQCSWLTCKLTLGVLHPMANPSDHNEGGGDDNGGDDNIMLVAQATLLKEV